MLFTLPGIPCLFTGQEIGASYEPYRRTKPLDWTKDPNGMEALYRELIANRRAHPVLASGALLLADSSEPERIQAWTMAAADESLLLATNLSASPAEAFVQQPSGPGSITVELPAWSSAQIALP